MVDKNQLRIQIRNQRKRISPEIQMQASQAIASRFLKSDIYKLSKHLAVYRSDEGEIDPIFIIKAAWHDQKQLYLPLINPEDHASLRFVPYSSDTPLIPNRFGILEPPASDYALPTLSALDTVLVPLVAVDHQGHRLGRGGGFYDKTFQFRKNTSAKPTLVGLAYAWQQLETIPFNDWDIPLDMVITDATPINL